MWLKRRMGVVGFFKILIPVCLCLFLTACAGPSVKPEAASKGVYHLVKKGETLWSISRAYHSNLQELAELNNITDAGSIEAGTVIFIPGAERVIENIAANIPTESNAKSPPASPAPVAIPPAKKLKKSETTSSKQAKHLSSEAAGKEAPIRKQDNGKKTLTEKTSEQDRIEIDKNRFGWPVKGTILSRYGVQPNGLKSNGIKIAAPEDTPVLAAAAGEVTFSDSLKYYGDTIIIRHDENFSTVYSSLKGRIVKNGEHVKRGEKIASLAKSENGQACLNFEIRQINKPRNPLFFLP